MLERIWPLWDFFIDCVDAGAMLGLQHAMMQKPRIKDWRKYYALIFPLAVVLYFCNHVLVGMTGVLVYPIVELVLMIWVYEDKPFFKRLAAPFIVMVIQVLADLLFMTVSTLFFPEMEYGAMVFSGPSIILMSYMLLSRSMIVLTVYIIARICARIQQSEDVFPKEGLFLVIPFLSIIIGLVIVGQTVKHMVDSATYLTITVLLVFVNIFAYIMMRVAARATQSAMRERAANTIQTLQQEQYRQMLERGEETRRWKHDINNHISTGVELIRSGKSDEAADYLTKVLGSVKESTFIIQSGNTVLDAILSAKLNECHNNGIKVSIEASIPDVLVNDIDTCTIFGNLFDNAINACKLLPEAERKLQFTMKPGENFTAITLVNPVPQQSDEQTWKRERKGELHGVGLSQVQRVADKYNGLFEYGVKGDKWTAKVAIPTPKDVIWLRTYNVEL